MSGKVSSNISDKLGFTPDIISGGSIIRIYGHEYIIIENYKSIIEYTNNLIRLQGKKERISIYGKKLSIAFFNLSDMRIDGIISNVTLGE